jgi:hypothetical protein
MLMDLRREPAMRRPVFAIIPVVLGVLAALAGISLPAAAPAPIGRPSQAAAVAAVPITVRVFEGNAFVPNLTLDDFELLESGFPAKPQALFLVRKNAVERQEGAVGVRPDFTRRICLIFQLSDYNNKIAEALLGFFESGLVPGDTVEIQTPVGNYGLTPEHLASKPRAVLARELNDIVRKDILRGNMGYNSLARDLKRIVRQISGAGRTGLSDTEGEIDDGTSLEQLFMAYAEDLQQVEKMRVLNEQALLRFGMGLKTRPGMKSVYYFYQREFRPEIDSKTINALLLNNQDRPTILSAVQTLFGMYNRDITIDHQRLRSLFADAGATFNFLFMNKDPERIAGVTMREQSEDIFKALSSISQATGGLTDSSQNPAASMKAALAATEACYVLYFTPSVSAPPGTFLNVDVKVKGRDYRVAYRAGYFARS